MKLPTKVFYDLPRLLTVKQNCPKTDFYKIRLCKAKKMTMAVKVAMHGEGDGDFRWFSWPKPPSYFSVTLLQCKTILQLKKKVET